MIEQKIMIMQKLSDNLKEFQQATRNYHQKPNYETYQSTKNWWRQVELCLNLLETVFEGDIK